MTEKAIRLYLDASGRSPFEIWFDEFSDAQAQQRILARIARLRLGNRGDWKSVGGAIFELRIHYGPGYRIYCAEDGGELVILLIGGDKRTQAKDIKRAKEFWDDYKKAKKSQEF